MPNLSYNGKVLKFGFNGGRISFPTPPVNPIVTVTKPDYGDPATYADHITDIVWLTRGNQAGLYNIYSESSYNQNDYSSPADTEWNSEYTDNVNFGWNDISNVRSRLYGTWVDSVGWDPSGELGRELILHLITDDKFYKVKFTQWTPSAAGGGFSYTREEIIPPPLRYDFTTTGDGTEVGTLSMTVSDDITMTLEEGTGKFYTNPDGTENESSTWNLSSGSTQTIYVKCPTGTTYMSCTDFTKITEWNEWTSSTDAPSIGATLTPSINLTYINIEGNNTVGGDIGSINGLTYLNIVGNSSTVKGSIDSKTNLTYLSLPSVSSSLSGSLANLTNLTHLNVGGNTGTVTGSVEGLTKLTYLQLTDSSDHTVTGSVVGLTGLTHIHVDGARNVAISGNVGTLSNLEHLWIDGGNDVLLSGSITGLTNLTTLRVDSYVDFTGDLNILTGLTYLHIFRTYNFTADIENLTNLTYLLLNFVTSQPITGDLTNLTKLTYLDIVSDANTNINFSGDTSSITGLTHFEVQTKNTIEGDISNWTDLTRLTFSGCVGDGLSGSVDNLTKLTSIRVYDANANTITGNITNCPLYYIDLRGTNTVYGDIGGDGTNAFINQLVLINLTNCAMVNYTSGATWPDISTIKINPSVGYGYSSTEIDNILIDMAASTSLANRTINLQGSNGVRTTASDDAVLTLQGRGCTLNLNTNP